MKSLISQIKNSLKSLGSRLDHVEDRLYGLEDKVDELELWDNYKEKNKTIIKRPYIWNMDIEEV
jgi:hypothetical protein